MINTRLKRLADGKLTLYHVTNSQLFMSIYQDGALMPGSETGITSSGSIDYDVSYSLFDASMHSPNQSKMMSIQELTDLMSNDSVIVTDELKDYIKNDNTNQMIEVAETNPMSGEGSVYLSLESGRDLYKSDTWDNRPYENYPAVNVELKVEVSTEDLGPDIDDGWYDENKPTPPWKQTLDTIGQCVHYGLIPMNEITGIYIDDLEPSNLDVLPINLNAEIEGMIYSSFDKIVKADTWLSPDEANNQLIAFYSGLNEVIEQIVQTANIKKSRLKKVARIRNEKINKES